MTTTTTTSPTIAPPDGGLYADLVWRGLVADATHPEELARVLNEESIAVYAGYDPTADSLHVGNLLIVMLLRRLQLAGHQVIALAGGGTGLIGDPSGKSTERVLHTHDTTSTWAGKITGQLERMLAPRGQLPAVHVNNLDWIGPLSAISLLRDVGKHFSVPAMLAKDSVRSRLGTESEGLSYTEFSYMLLQSYDFQHLYDAHACRLQVGGSDQWGNITAGLDLLRRTGRPGAFGLTTPLITRSDGRKFGKSEDGAIWLDPTRTSPYALYQYFLGMPDEDVDRMLRMLTLLPRAVIEELAVQTRVAPAGRAAQQALAAEIVTFVHGPAALAQALEITELVFTGRLAQLDPATADEALAGAPVVRLSRSELGTWEHLVHRAGVADSVGAARRLIAQGGVYVDATRVAPASTPADALASGGRLHVLRRGRRVHVVLDLAD